MRIYQPNERTKAQEHARKVYGDVRLDGIHGAYFVTENAQDRENLRFLAEPEDIEERYPLLAGYAR